MLHVQNFVNILLYSCFFELVSNSFFNTAAYEGCISLITLPFSNLTETAIFLYPPRYL